MKIIVNHKDGSRAFLRDYNVLRYDNGKVMATFTSYRTTRVARLALQLSADDAEDWINDAHHKPAALKARHIQHLEAAL